MSFPHTEEVCDRLQTEATPENVHAAVTLLKQYKRLTETHAATIANLRENAGNAAQLKARIVELETACRNMEAHPDVKAARRAKLEQQKADAERELAALT